MRRSRLLPALAAALLTPGCVSFNLSEQRLFQPPPADEVAALRPGDELAAVLDRLGAPSEVAEDGDGMILSWLWDQTDASGFNVRVPTGNSRSVSFNWLGRDHTAQRLRLRFDAGWRLVQVVDEGGA